jgi:GntP family gluconate:H+ symporter
MDLSFLSQYAPLWILLLGISIVMGMILVLKANAFLALITAAFVVSLLSPGDIATKISRVAEAFGGAAGKIGIVIALAAVIGKCLMDSGAADRIVRSFLRALGERRAPLALMASGWVLSVPVFFDTVFYLLVPLARSLHLRTRKDYLLYVLAIGAGGAITHTLVPPTPGPLAVAGILKVDLGLMIMVGAIIALPTAVVGMLLCRLMNRLMVVPMRPIAGQSDPEPLADEALPPLWLSLLPVLLPVVLISANTVTKMLAAGEDGGTAAVQWTSVLGDPNFALFLSAVVAMYTLVRWRGLNLRELASATENALMSAGVIILITAAGGAFGAMLRVSGVEAIVQQLAGSGGQFGFTMLVVAFAVAAILKTAQGSSTVAMMTTAAMMEAIGVSATALGFHPVYLCTTIAGGSLVICWMNDSGFWVVSRMSGLTEMEAVKAWTGITGALGTSAFLFSLLAAWLVPLSG